MTPLDKSELAHKLFDQAKQDQQLPESARLAFVMGVLAGIKESHKALMLKAMEQASEDQREVIRKAERDHEEKRNQEMLRYSPDESISL